MAREQGNSVSDPGPHGIDRRGFIGGLVAGAAASGMLAGCGSKSTASPGSSARRTIVITAPTGNVGSRVAANVLESGSRVRLVARDPSKLPEDVRQRVEIVQGSHGERDVVMRAFEGADTVFWICPPDPRAANPMEAYLGFTRPAVEAIRNQGVRRVVTVSALGRGTPLLGRAGYVTASHAMCELIASTGVHFRALVCPSFMDNIARQARTIKENGFFSSPIDGDRKMPSCATRDIAASATRLLLDPSWDGQGELAVLGPEDISFNDMARIMTEVIGKPIRFERVSFEDYKATFMRFGMSEGMAQGMTDMAQAKNDGLDNAEPRTAENTTPTSFRQWCEEELKPLILT